MQKPIEKKNCKVSSPCTPMHLIPDSWCKERTETGQDYIHSEPNKNRMRKANKSFTQKSCSKIHEDEVSVSSKASNAASPLKICSTSLSSNGCSKKESKGISYCYLKKKIRSPYCSIEQSCCSSSELFWLSFACCLSMAT
jgi:hypothetical protein